MEATLIRPAIDRFRRLCGIWRAASCGAAGLLAFSGMVSCNFGVEGGSSALSDHFSGISAATTLSPTSIKVSWQPQDGYTSYSVFSSSQDSPVATFTTGESYTVTGLRPNSTYSFSVVGTDSNGNQYGMGNQISGTTWQNFLGPTQAAAVDAHTVNLIWNYNAGPTFNVYYQAGSTPTIASGTPPALLPAAQTTSQFTGINVSGLQPNTTYYFMVAAKYSDGTDSFQDSQTATGTVTAMINSQGSLLQVPTITTQALLDTSTPPTFTISGAPSSFVFTFYLYDPTATSNLDRGQQLLSTSGNGTVTATAPLPSGPQSIIVDIHDVAEPSGSDGTATLNGISVVQALPNNGLKIASATTPSPISPMPTITNNLISLGPFPQFTISGGLPNYTTTLYDSSNVILGTLQGNGAIQIGTSTPLPRGPNTLHAIVSFEGATAEIDNIKVNVKFVDKQAITPPTTLNGGVGYQGFGQNLVVGDFNCDGYPDLAVSAPYGNGQVYVYYGTPTGLDMSATPSATATGTKPLYIPTPVGFGGGVVGGGALMPYAAYTNISFGYSMASGNFNGFHDPITTRACSDLVVSAPDIYNWLDAGAVFVFYGSSSGLQTNGGVLTPSTVSQNAMSCTGGSSNSCQPEYLCTWTSGIPEITPPGQTYIYAQGYDGMGQSVAAGDIDGDGYDDLVAATVNDDAEFGSYSRSGAMMMWRGTPAGLSPIYTQVIFPQALTQNAGAPVNAEFGAQVAIGHFTTSQKGLGPADVAVSFGSLSPASGVTNPHYQSGVIVIPGMSTPPYISIDSTHHVNNYILIAPAFCNAWTWAPALGTGWGNGSYCVDSMHSLLAADVNQDGYDDLLFSSVAIYNPGGGYGSLFTYYGGSNLQTEATTLPSSAATCPKTSLSCSTPQVSWINTPTAMQFGMSINYLGDVNGDGYPDIGIGAINTQTGPNVSAGTAYIFHGGATGLSTTAPTTINPSKPAYAYFGSSIAAAKFESQTGFTDYVQSNATFNDLAVGAVGDSPPLAARTNGVITTPMPSLGDAHEAGTVSIYTNAAPGLGVTQTTATATLAPINAPPTLSTAGWVQLAGDINGDGYADAIMQITLPGPMNYVQNITSMVLQESYQTGFIVFYGSPSGLISSPTPTYNPVNPTDPLIVTNYLLNDGPTGPYANPLFAYTLYPTGDVNGDGFADVMTGYVNQADYFFYGSASGLVVAPAPEPLPYDTSHRPSLNPMTLSQGNATIPLSNVYGYLYSPNQIGWYETYGDFNGDGYSDIVFISGGAEVWPPVQVIAVIYGSALGPVSGGHVYTSIDAPWASAPANDRLQTSPTCSGAPLICTPLSLLALPSMPGMFNAGDMDGDGTDDLVVLNGMDPSWGYTSASAAAGTVSIYYGSKTNGLDPNLFVNLRISYTNSNRELGTGIAAAGAYTRAYDINKDGLADFVLSSYAEQTFYVIYGLTGGNGGASPTSNSGAYLNQGYCKDTSGNPTSSFPCYVYVTPVATPDFSPNHLTTATAAKPNSCSQSLNSCNVMVYTEGSDGILGTGDITGDGFADVVFSNSQITVDGLAIYGTLNIAMGSANGLQVAATPVSRPNCYPGGTCDPYTFYVPVNTAQTPVGQYAFFLTAGWNGAFDVDGDGFRDFVITSSTMNAVDSNNNVVAKGTGGFYLFH